MLRISKPDYDLIRWEAESSYPHECCGILLGNTLNKERVVTLTVPCENTIADSPGNRYSIHQAQVIAELNLARSRADSTVGVNHSPPHHTAQDSVTDSNAAPW